jgi:hypothetical protein
MPQHRGLNRLPAQLVAGIDRLTAALIDVPHAVGPRHLVAGQRIPKSAGSIPGDCTRTLIADG